MAQTESKAGASAYAAFYMGILHCDEGAVYHVDADLLEQGLIDMIAQSEHDPAQINSILAYWFDVSLDRFITFGETEHPEVATKRKVLRQMIERLMRTYFNAFVPDMWQYSYEDMQHIISTAFRDELTAGAPVTISAQGTEIEFPDASTNAWLNNEKSRP